MKGLIFVDCFGTLITEPSGDTFRHLTKSASSLGSVSSQNEYLLNEIYPYQAFTKCFPDKLFDDYMSGCVINRELIDLLNQHSADGYEIIVVSDFHFRSELLGKWLLDNGLHFSFIHTSCSVGLSKRTGLWKYIYSVYGTPTFVIGDDLVSDYEYMFRDIDGLSGKNFFLPHQFTSRRKFLSVDFGLIHKAVNRLRSAIIRAFRAKKRELSRSTGKEWTFLRVGRDLLNMPVGGDVIPAYNGTNICKCPWELYAECQRKLSRSKNYLLIDCVIGQLGRTRSFAEELKRRGYTIELFPLVEWNSDSTGSPGCLLSPWLQPNQHGLLVLEDVFASNINQVVFNGECNPHINYHLIADLFSEEFVNTVCACHVGDVWNDFVMECARIGYPLGHIMDGRQFVRQELSICR